MMKASESQLEDVSEDFSETSSDRGSVQPEITTQPQEVANEPGITIQPRKSSAPLVENENKKIHKMNLAMLNTFKLYNLDESTDEETDEEDEARDVVNEQIPLSEAKKDREVSGTFLEKTLSRVKR